MKGKKYQIIIISASFILAVLLIITGCSIPKPSLQESSVASSAQISADTASQTKEKQQNTELVNYDKWICTVRDCNFIYDPAIGDPSQGIAPGTSFEDLPVDWRCPICGKGKELFVVMSD